MSQPIGVVTGMLTEAACLPASDAIRIRVSGADSDRARAGAEGLLAEGVVGLVSFGLAGGLDPSLRPGDLVLADAVLLPSGEALPTDPAWRARLIMAAERLAVRTGSIAGSDHVLTTPAAKQALHAATGAVAVDMESHAVAAAALRAGVPFVVVRAIADPFDRSIPAAARLALGPDGRVRYGGVSAALLRRPWQIVGLARLGWDSHRALRALRRVAALAGPTVAFG